VVVLYITSVVMQHNGDAFVWRLLVAAAEAAMVGALADWFSVLTMFAEFNVRRNISWYSIVLMVLGGASCL
jgi:uncharacterized membrane-anchored protein YjiN (DUF445 family)